MSVVDVGVRVQRTDQPDWGPGTVDYISDVGSEARVLFAGGFVVAWVPLVHLAPWPVASESDQ